MLLGHHQALDDGFCGFGIFLLVKPVSEIWLQDLEGGWLVHLLLGCFGWLDHLQLQLLQKKKSNQEQRRTIYDALNINFEWCQLLRLLICCWLGKVDDTKVALFTNYDHIQLVHLNKILIDSTRGAPNSTGWAPTIVVNAVTWGP